MQGLRATKLVLLGTICAWLSPSQSWAQAPQELGCTEPGGDEPLRPLVIQTVRFEGAVRLPEAIRRQFILLLQRCEFDADSGWVGQIQEAAKGLWQDHGYFKATVRANARPVNGDPLRRQVTIHIQEGEQYRLGGIRFVDATAFSLDELRAMIPLSDGEIFSVGRIRKSLDTLKQAYSSRGYIDFVVSPQTEFDESGKRITLLLEMTTGRQFFIEKVEVLGADARTEALLRSKIRIGEPFNHKLLSSFFRENEWDLPRNASERDVDVSRDPQTGTVALRFDFRPRPQLDTPFTKMKLLVHSIYWLKRNCRVMFSLNSTALPLSCAGS